MSENVARTELDVREPPQDVLGLQDLHEGVDSPGLATDPDPEATLVDPPPLPPEHTPSHELPPHPESSDAGTAAPVSGTSDDTVRPKRSDQPPTVPVHPAQPAQLQQVERDNPAEPSDARDASTATLAPNAPSLHTVVSTNARINRTIRNDPERPGTRLNHEISCIIAPNFGRFRALIKYVGPMPGRKGSWIGVEVPCTASTGSLEALPFATHQNRQWQEDCVRTDGTLNGARLFYLGDHDPLSPTSSLPQSRTRLNRVQSHDWFRPEAPEVRASRLSLSMPWHTGSECDCDDTGNEPSQAIPSLDTQRHRRERWDRVQRVLAQSSRVSGRTCGSTYTGSETPGSVLPQRTSTKSVGLFIRPCDVLVVVGPGA